MDDQPIFPTKQEAIMIFDESFDHAYECRLIETPPSGDIRMYCYPGGIAGGWVHGVGVEVIPHSSTETWIGSFANGDLSPNATSGVFSLPSPKHLLVIAKGDGHVVNVEDPKEFLWVDQILPIVDVLPFCDLGLIVLHDFTRILALGKSGVVWETPRLSWDGLKIDNVKDDVIHGYSWDAPNNCNVSFEINASSGVFKGGASPELIGIR